MKKTEKTLLVQNLTKELEGASCVVLVDYSGLTVKAQQELKRRLRKVSARLIVTKNTLFKLAGEAAKLSKESLTDSVLSGPTALVITEADPVAPIQVLGRFAVEFELPQLKVGVVEGKFQDTQNLIKLSNLPNKEVLIGQAIGAIAAPMYGFVAVLQGNLQKLVYILEQASKRVEE